MNKISNRFASKNAFAVSFFQFSIQQESTIYVKKNENKKWTCGLLARAKFVVNGYR